MIGVAEKTRKRILISGHVQGVGFRPFVYRLATDLGLAGWVSNNPQGVIIEVEGTPGALEDFVCRLREHAPRNATIAQIETHSISAIGASDFKILHSASNGRRSALVLPDLAVCPDCIREVFDPSDRRYLYPFTNCTNCGPRYSIMEVLPYDRCNTTMRDFEMCPDCRREYNDPRDRRFHAQPIACPACGPHVELWRSDGSVLGLGHSALLEVADALRGGRIVAVKGLGGFHLMVDAGNAAAVGTLRDRKHREEKPFALMVASIEQAREICELSAEEEELLTSREAPIVLLLRKRSCPGNIESADRSVHATESDSPWICEEVAPFNPYLGVLLPYTPLHHMLLREIGKPIVATSGNITDEPICTDEKEALARLGGIADLFLVHNRPIAVPLDDSVVRIAAGRELVLRCARGFAPLSIPAKSNRPTTLAVGGFLKNTVAITNGDNIILGQHIGDLETSAAWNNFKQSAGRIQALHEVNAELLVCDNHPDYPSTRYARAGKAPVISVQHHFAHVLACMVENELHPPVLGVAWDGTGLGTDDTIWGGEFLKVCASRKVGAEAQPLSFERVAHLRPFRLAGGDSAAKEPRRSALSLLCEAFGTERATNCDVPTLESFTKPELGTILRAIERGVNCPVTTSIGRLFDAFASLLGIRQRCSFEGQAAMELEFLATGVDVFGTYQFKLRETSGGCIIIDWEPVLCEAMEDIRNEMKTPMIAAKFHSGLAVAIAEVAERIGVQSVALGGGCFQNKCLLEQSIARLRERGLSPYWPRRVPPNDNGISVGQAYAATRWAEGTV